MRIMKSCLLGAAILALGFALPALKVGSLGTETPVFAQAPAQGQTVPPRMEKDLLGEKQIPADAYYGVQTARALENFQISGDRDQPLSRVRRGLGDREARRGARQHRGRRDEAGARSPRSRRRAQAVLDGKYHDQFLVDWYQGGAGTSTNMNANEVLANIGLELTGHKKGEYKFLEPHDDLNMSQSTNDSYPTAIKVAFILRNDKLIAELRAARRRRSARRATQYLEIVKMGRTELQDAVPMTVGQEFHAFAASLEGEIQLLRDAEKYLYAVNMGATAIGTGINVPKGYAEKCAAQLAKLTGKPIVPATDMFAATWDQQGFVVYSVGAEERRDQAVEDRERPDPARLRVRAPAWPRSTCRRCSRARRSCRARSIPVIPELVNLVAFRVMGNDYAVTLAAHSGQLQLNAYEPLEGLAMMESQHLLFNTLAGVPHQVRRRHHGEREGARALHGDDGRHRDRAQSGARLREGDRARGRGLQERQGHPRDHPREEGPDRGADQGPARSGRS